MAYIPNESDQSTIRTILERGETAVVVEATEGYEILGVANYPRSCREYYIGRLVLSVFRSPFDLEARLALARAKAGRPAPVADAT
ncbi:MAG TPA: hypothetical protein VFZ25_06505 [Chloroflexota bacterium]|nr:hypothetical protein [Chloroflexota bacterium]